MIKKIEAYSGLEETLQNIVSICRILVGVLKDEQDHLVRKKNTDWDSILDCKQKALKNLGQAEQEWRRKFYEIALSSGFQKMNCSLTEFLEDLSDSEGYQLREIQKELLDSLHDICVLNRQNASLLRHALYYNQSFLSLMHAFVDRTKSLIYGPQGKPEPFSIQLIGKRI
ncbi:MAG: flagellar protein FlgN [Elusimicrobiota bacterium]